MAWTTTQSWSETSEATPEPLNPPESKTIAQQGALLCLTQLNLDWRAASGDPTLPDDG